MASPFSRTIRSLNAESPRHSTTALIAAAALLGGERAAFRPRARGA
jgi:hypothetical protein